MAADVTYTPEERASLRFGATAAVGLHVFVAGLVALVAFLTHIKTIQQLMAEGGAIAQNGPAPEEQMEVILVPDELPPPPTPNPEFIRQIVQPKPVVIPPPRPVVPKPQPKPVVHPRYVAPKATGSGDSATVSRLVVGSSGFPHPGYPYEALQRHQTGTVNVSIQFDSAGYAEDVEIVGSSGVAILDSSAQSFIRANWHNESFAGRHATVPIEFTMDQP
jgi:TonB family protein